MDICHSPEVGGGPQTSERQKVQLRTSPISQFSPGTRLAQYTSQKLQTNLPVVLWTSLVSEVGSSQNLTPSSFVGIVVAGDFATLPTFDGCHSWLDVLEPWWLGFGGATTMPCQSLPPRPHNTSTLAPISVEASQLARVSFETPLTVPSWRLELLPSHAPDRYDSTSHCFNTEFSVTPMQPGLWLLKVGDGHKGGKASRAVAMVSTLQLPVVKHL